ncbi:uncharacterized protein LOC129971742 [Argiope bruennichi]|uniref:uncharacterized protein LOC129971742 n=1 Tax=Argiope bruennichi TaxID=94029 RepID=UPI0024940B5F|nr:uncharacterized protein LOC129971742 [Argiope bruennichi]
MHRFYQPILPSSNLFLQHKWDFINYETHRQKVKNIRSKIDQTAPRTYPHLYLRPKQLQLEMERFCTIQRQNKYLLEKVEKIHRYGGWIDTDNSQHKPRSINTIARQKEAVRVSYENQTMLNRIKGEHTSYNRSQLESSFAMQEKYRANIDKFPREWQEMSKDMKRFRADIRKKYIYPKYGKPKSQKKKLKKIEQKTEPEQQLIASAEEPEITIYVPEAAELKEEPKHHVTILERIRNIFARKHDETQIEILAENGKEGEDSKPKDEIHQDKEKDDKNQDKEKDDANQDKEMDETNQNEVDQDKQKDEVNQNEENNKANEDQKKDEINQEKDVENDADEVEEDTRNSSDIDNFTSSKNSK